MGGSSTPSRTTTTNEPPAILQPYLKKGLDQSVSLYDTGGPQYFPGQTVVPYSDTTNEALDLTRQRALNGSQVGNAAQSYVTNTLNSTPVSYYGAFQDPTGKESQQFNGQTNPYLDATFNRAADQVQNRLQSSFAGAGRNIGAARAPAALELNDLANQVYGGAYDQDRNRQLSELQQLRGIRSNDFQGAAGRIADDISQQRALQFSTAQLAPQLANMDYADLAALEGVGGRQEDLQRQYLDADIDRFNFQQQAPQINLDNYLARITGSFPGGTQTSITPNTRNRAGGALGGAASGAAVGSAFGPYGTAIGAIGGGLLGAFG